MVDACHYRRFVWNLALEYRSQYRRHRRAGTLILATKGRPTRVSHAGAGQLVVPPPPRPSLFANPYTALTHYSAHPEVVTDAPMASNAKAMNRLHSELRQWAVREPGMEWISEGASVVGQGALRDLDRAFENFFAGRAGYPQFKRRDDRAGGLTIRDVSVHRLNKKWATVMVPKVGHVRFRITRLWADIAAASSARVSLAHGHWHISFTTAPPSKKPGPGTGAVVGIDRGVANTLATSEGAFVHMPGLTIGEQQRFLALEQRLARQTRTAKAARRPLHECRNRGKTLDALAALRLRLDNRRTNFVEQTTTDLATRYDTVVLENLSTKNMTRRPAPKPDPENAGVWLPNNARAKATLNRLILASRWAEFATRLEHKTTGVVYVSAAYTSQQCRACGHTSSDNRESQAVFTCTRCDHTNHADTNAALNILNRGTTNPGTPGDCLHQHQRRNRPAHQRRKEQS